METQNTPSGAQLGSGPSDGASSVGLIYDLLRDIQLATTSKADREKAQNRLNSLSQYVIQHARDLTEVAAAPGLPQTDPVKRIAAIQFKGHVTKSVKNHSMASAELLELADLSIKILMSSSVQVNMKVHIQEALLAVIKTDCKTDSENNVRVTDAIFEDFLANKLQIARFDALESFSQVLGLLGNYDVVGVIRVINAFLIGNNSRQKSLSLLQVCQPLIVLCTSNEFFNPLMQAVHSLLIFPAGPPSAQPSAPVASGEQRTQQIFALELQLQYLSAWLQLLLSVLKHYNKNNFVDGVKFFACQRAFSIAMRSTLMIAASQKTVTMPDGIQKNFTCLLQDTESGLPSDTAKARTLMNQITSKAMRFYKIMWQYLWELKPEGVFSGENPYLVDAHFFFPQLADTLTYLAQCGGSEGEEMDLESFLDDSSEAREVVMKSLEVLTIFSNEPEFQPFFECERGGLFLRLIVPFLRISEQERETMETDPKEFCHLIEDVCGDQKSSTVKVKTAKLLCALGENIPAFFPELIAFCIRAVQASLTKAYSSQGAATADSPDNDMSDPGNAGPVVFTDPAIAMTLSRFNLKFNSVADLSEVCLVAITATAHLFEDHREVQKTFDRFMLENLQTLLKDKAQGVLVRQRASLLCSFTLDFIFQTLENAEERDQGLDMILTCLLADLGQKSKRSKVLSIQALETLQISSIGDDAFGQRIQINFDWVVEQLTTYVRSLNLPDFFDFAVNFVSTFHGSFTERNLGFLMEAIVQRIASEHSELVKAKQPTKTLDLSQGKVKRTKKSSKNIEFRIAKCWSLIRYIAEHRHFCDKMVPVIENAAVPLLLLIENLDQVDFDDDLIFLISSMLKKSRNTNSVILREAFQYMPNFLEKFNYIPGPLLECLSLYTMYSRVNETNSDWIATSQDNLQTLFDMAKSTLFPPTPQASPLDGGAESGPSYVIEGALILQIIFQNLNGAPLLDFLIAPTVQLVFNKLAEGQQSGGRKTSATLKRHLIITLLSCVLHKPQATVEAIEAHGGQAQLQAFISELVDQNQTASEGNPSCCTHKKLKSPYEFKVYTVALTNLVFETAAPGQVKAALLRQVVLSLTKQQRNEQRKLLQKATQEAHKALKKRKASQKQPKRVREEAEMGDSGGAPRNTMITQMVDKILLQEGDEIGLNEADQEANLSGDEVKTPIFVIRKEGGSPADLEESKGEGMEDEAEYYEQCFVQEEYDLANDIDQMTTRLDSFDEFSHLRQRAQTCHAQNPQLFQSLVGEGLTSQKQKDYLKQILQSRRVVLAEGEEGVSEQYTTGVKVQEANVPRRIIKVKRSAAVPQ